MHLAGACLFAVLAHTSGNREGDKKTKRQTGSDEAADSLHWRETLCSYTVFHQTRDLERVLTPFLLLAAAVVALRWLRLCDSRYN